MEHSRNFLCCFVFFSCPQCKVQALKTPYAVIDFFVEFVGGESNRLFIG